jgi:hypothetical protein
LLICRCRALRSSCPLRGLVRRAKTRRGAQYVVEARAGSCDLRETLLGTGVISSAYVCIALRQPLMRRGGEGGRFSESKGMQEVDAALVKEVEAARPRATAPCFGLWYIKLWYIKRRALRKAGAPKKEERRCGIRLMWNQQAMLGAWARQLASAIFESVGVLLLLSGRSNCSQSSQHLFEAVPEHIVGQSFQSSLFAARHARARHKKICTETFALTQGEFAWALCWL